MPDLQVGILVLCMVNLGLVRKAFLQPTVKEDEEIPPHHFIDFEFRDAFCSVVPVIRYDGV